MTDLLGRRTAGTSADFNGSGHTALWRFTAVASGRLATLKGQTKVANATGVVTMGVYADSAGAVSTFLGKATATGATGTGVFSADISAAAIDIVSGSSYWLGWRNSAENFNFQGDASGSYVENAGTADFPTPWGSAGSGSVNAIIWGEDAGGPTPVVSTRQASYDVQNQVTSTRQASYDVLNSVVSSRQASYDVLGSVLSTRDTSYDVLTDGTAVISLRDASYDVAGSVLSSRQTSFDVQAGVVSTRQTSYDVQASVVSTRTTSYDVINGVTSTRVASYDVGDVVFVANGLLLLRVA